MKECCIFLSLPFMKFLKVFLLIFVLNQLRCNAQTTDIPLLSPAQAQSDVSFFEKLFFSTHVDLALVTDTSLLRFRIDTLRSGLDDSISATELYRRLTPVFSSVRDIHCSLSLPAESNDYLQAGNLYLPLYVFCSNRELFIKGDFFDSCMVGGRIISINDVQSDSIFDILMLHSASEGENIHSREKIAEYHFPSVYPLYFNVDSVNTILIEYNGDTLNNFLPGVDPKLSLYSDYFENGFDEQKHPYQFGFTDDKTIAYIRIESFMGGNPGEYRYFLKNAFLHINRLEPVALILDLRHNGGGFADYGKFLTRFLMKERYTYVHNLVSRSSKIAQREIIRQTPFQPEIVRLLQYTFGNKAMRGLWNKKEGLIDTTYEKQVKPFRSGKVYSGFLVVMFDGMSASTTGLVCNTLRKRPNTLFTGLPAGCTVSGTFGQPTEFELPNSGIIGYISILRFNQDTNPSVLTPIMPDVELPESASDLIFETDSQLNSVLKLIREKIREK
ncbi:MAG TPA: hypothetical protein DHV29_05470 [Bacteroidales bacterium]|nr:hypothetical protein [Bacteroidales bacterium]HCY22922.1 hypothetical protein [Bacteroidales bacterium]